LDFNNRVTKETKIIDEMMEVANGDEQMKMHGSDLQAWKPICLRMPFIF
jgi:hypothetical protein